MEPRVLVTGATSGIGEATVDRLLETGWEVHATARSQEDLGQLEAKGAVPVQLDLRDEGSIRKAATVLGHEEPLHGLVHNAGIGIPGAVEDLPPAAWRQQFEVNVLGPAELTRCLAPALRRAEGRIVLVSSQAAMAPVPYYGAYCASKVALEAVGDALRLELAQAGVGVSIVQPGPVETGFQPRARELLERYVDVEASPHRAAYEDLDAVIVERLGAIGTGAVVDAIERALTARRAPARVPVGRLSWLGAKLAAWLPDPLSDRALRWVFQR